jgi:CBS domain-containing protein
MALACANAGPLLETTMKKERKPARQLLFENPREVISVGPADAVLTALRLMADEDVTTVLVLHSSNLVGILSQRDYARKVELAGRSAAETKVGEITTTQVFYVTPEHTCEQCLALMHTRRIRHLPVIDSGQVIGVLSNSDVLEELIQEDEHFISILEHDMLYLAIDTGGAY